MRTRSLRVRVNRAGDAASRLIGAAEYGFKPASFEGFVQEELLPYLKL